MEAGPVALLCLGLAVVVVLGVALARRTGLPDPVVLVVVGLGASFLPGAPHTQIPPEVVFLVFLPPLLFRASFLTSLQTLRQHATAITLLSVGLVVTTALGVAAVVSLLPGVTFAQGMVLGAVVGPTDPVAAAGVFQRLGAPRRVVELVEAESLMNDATALVLYAVAVEAVLHGTPSAVSIGLTLVTTVLGGLGIGLALAGAVRLVRARVSDVGLQLLVSLVTPYLAYVLADRAGVSGVLAVVTAGVLVGIGPTEASEARLQGTAFWSFLDLLLNAVLFVLLGLAARRVLDDIPHLDPTTLVLGGLGVVGVVIGLRVAWQFVVPPVAYRLRSLAGRPVSRSTTYERFVIGWTGMRGAISLAAALALPLELPNRSLLVFLTVVVVLSTLVLQGLTLPLVLRRGALAETDDGRENETRRMLAEVALRRMDELEADGTLPPGSADPLREVWEQARARVSDDLPDPEVDLVSLRLEIAKVQGEELAELRRTGAVDPEVARLLQEELDLQRVRLS